MRALELRLSGFNEAPAFGPGKALRDPDIGELRVEVLQ